MIYEPHFQTKCLEHLYNTSKRFFLQENSLKNRVLQSQYKCNLNIIRMIKCYHCSCIQIKVEYMQVNLLMNRPRYGSIDHAIKIFQYFCSLPIGIYMVFHSALVSLHCKSKASGPQGSPNLIADQNPMIIKLQSIFFQLVLIPLCATCSQVCIINALLYLI